MSQSYESKRRVRILSEHTHLPEQDDYHEWVERQRDMDDCEVLDLIGRKGNSGWYRWDYWCCNNGACDALALVSAVEMERTAQDWLNTRSPAEEPHG